MACTEAAAVRLTINYPFWAELYFSMDVIELHDGHPLSQQIQTCATDGKKLWVYVPFFSKLKLAEQVTILAHELGHKMFLHPTRCGFRDPGMWNVACDYAINSLLTKNGFQFPGVAGKDYLLDAKYDGWLAEAIYADLMKQPQAQQMPQSLRDLMEPENLSPEERDQMEQAIQAVVERAVANAKARGDVPKGIDQGLLRTYRASNEKWYNHLHRYMQSLASSEYNWTRLNRRTLRTHGFFSPHHMSEALGDVVLFIDGSGSCFTRAQQAHFAEHVNAIMGEAKPRRVVVYYFDTQCYDAQEQEPGALELDLRPKGGGGTSFVDLFTTAEADGYCPDVAIVLTDMEGTFPAQEPPFPVIWADVDGGHHGAAPFGEYLEIE